MYKITGNLQAGVVEITADLESDVQDLPTDVGTGSTCFVIESSSVYMLGNDKNWHLI